METGTMKLYEVGSFSTRFMGNIEEPRKTKVRRLYADYFVRRVDTGNNQALEFYRNLPDGSSYLYATYTLYNGYAEEIEADA